ncbi:hypothetical protein ACFOY4_09920 [Actinomadura syzygii]|uniref:Uncharacterized protein n=1 Tax=Actinomadura syzygii TaxID=1427538 RepID=A0A5D0UFG1_9ACTN|nr:hypothetical protein [Actinomadura syzygii]TYC15869.1 hypothetical protein FXF65_11035 [Actinomadura syzygii]
MAEDAEDKKESRFNVAFPAWLALIGVLVASILSSAGTYFVAQINIKADESKRGSERRFKLEDEQRDARKKAYQDFLIAAEKAAIYERSLWCKNGHRAPSPSGVWQDDYNICPNAPDGTSIQRSLADSSPIVLLYAGDDVRNYTYQFVAESTFLLKNRKKLEAKAKATSFSDNPEGYINHLEWKYMELASYMCKDQSLLPNKCKTPILK